jgi:hypothetical protein
VRAHHLSPDGLGAGGWSNTPRIVVPFDAAFSSHWWPDLALAPDGGVFLSWATWSPDTTLVESAMRLRRLTPSGLNATGWPPEGRWLAPFRPEPLGQSPFAPLLAIAADGRGGVFAHIGTLLEMLPFLDTRLYRLAGDGEPSPGWPPEGFPIKASATYYNGDFPEIADAGLGVRADHQDRAIVEFQNPTPTRPPPGRESGQQQRGRGLPNTVIAVGHEIVVRATAASFAADFALRPRQSREWPAPPGLHAEPDGAWPSHFEVHTEPLLTWYGDTRWVDRRWGRRLFLSQLNDLHGLFARRFNPTREVTGVGQAAAPIRSAIRSRQGCCRARGDRQWICAPGCSTRRAALAFHRSLIRR